MNPHDLIVRPLMTEKSTLIREQENKVCFVVRGSANQKDVKKAIEETLDVKVKKVNILNMLGKKKRLNRFVGKCPDWKKAIVTLEKGEKIDLLEA
ncbi:50S ribosomal protein L23 [Nitrospira defluvii]|nr:50S ribosomal protein L23 [Nitrospira defluvii]